MHWFVISSAIAFSFNVFLACLVYFNNPKNLTNKFYALMNFSIGFWNLFAIFEVLSMNGHVVLVLDKVLHLFAISFPLLYVYFIFSIIEEKPGEKLLNFINLYYLFLLGLNLSSQLVPKVEMKSFMGFIYFYASPGSLYPFFPLFLLCCTTFALISLFLSYQKSVGNKRNQLGCVILASIIGLPAPITHFVVIYGKAVPPFGPLFTVAYSLLIAYAITKHRLMDISVIISRSLAEFLTTIFYGLVYLILVWAHHAFISSSVDTIFLAGTILYGILVGQTYQSMRLKVQTTSDKLFLRGKYDYYKELSDITTQVTKILSMDNILNTLHKAFYEVIEISNPRIYLAEDLNKSEIQGLLILKEPTFIDEDFIIPCLLENRLIALIVLGKKLSEDPYTDKDIRLLKVLASQAAVAIDHTRTYEQIKKEYELEHQAKEKALDRALTAEELADKAKKEMAVYREMALQTQHEIKNPLAAIGLHAALLPRQLHLEREEDKKILREFTEMFDKQSQIICGVTEKLRAYGAPKKSDKFPSDINKIISEELFLLKPQFEARGIKVEKKFGELPPVKVNPEELSQVFSNLFINAIQAMKNGGDLVVAACQGQHRINGKTVEAVVIKVKDTGEGIPEKNKTRIFSPMFTTRYDGTGLGLSTSFRIIVDDHEGAILCDSEAGKGTEFTIALPL